MTLGGSRLESARVAVISCSLLPEENELWDAAAGGVGELRLIGAKGARSDPRVPHGVALSELMTGKGLIWRHLVGLHRELRRFRPDLVHVNGELWSVTAQEVLGRHQTVVVHGAENLWQHGGGLERQLRTRLVDHAVRRIAGYVSWNEAGAEHVRATRSRLVGDELPTAVLPAIVPPAPFRAASSLPPDEGAPLEILLVGRVTAEKGFSTVIQAAHRLGRPVRVTLCGEGPEEEALAQFAREYAVPFRAPGWLDAPELAALMAASHVLVQPSRDIADWSEQFGRTVAEAMTVGLPVIVSDAGALPEVVGHQAAALFRQGDAEGLMDRLTPLTTPERLAALAEPQRARADAYLPERAAATLLEVWRDVLEG